MSLLKLLAGTVVAGALSSVSVAQQTKTVPGELVVRFSESTSLVDVSTVVAASGCEIIRPLAHAPGHYLVGVVGRDKSRIATSNLVADLEIAAKMRSGGAISADLNYIVTLNQVAPQGQKILPNDKDYGKQWHYDLIRMPEAWNIQGGKRIIRVGVIDTGVQSDHADFKMVSGISRVERQEDFALDAPSTGDLEGHGTHVAGTVAASTNNTEGVSGVAGWERQGLDVRIVSGRAFAGRTASTDQIISAIRWMITQHVDVVNMSFGTSGNSTTMESAVRDLVLDGAVTVASAGNDGLDMGTNPFFPATYPFVINVTAVGPTKTLASYSNFGGANLRIIGAPGGAGNGNPLDDVLSTVPLGKYEAFPGTSMAAPHVAGVAALLIASGCPKGQVYAALAAGAQPALDGPNESKYGPGILDAYSSLLPFADPDPDVDLTGGTGVDKGTTYFHQVPVSMVLSGVSKILASGATLPKLNESDITVEIQTVGRTSATLKTYVGGRNGTGHFDIPSLSPGDMKGKSFTVSIPRNPDESIRLGAGQYKVVVKLGGVDKSVQFVTVVDKVLPRGRSLMSVPFKIPTSSLGVTPERTMFGVNTAFSLARYNPLRSPGGLEYGTYSEGSVILNAPAGPFAPRLVTSGQVVTFEQGNPSASISPIGNGYWLNVDRSTVIDTSNLATPGISASSALAVDSVGIQVFATNGGWNMIGAPFLYPVDWNAVSIVVDGSSHSLSDAVQLGFISPVLVGYTNSDYSYSVAPGGRLEPFQGYWVRTYRDLTIVVPPAASQGATRASQTNLQYGLKIGAFTKTEKDAENIIGVMAGSKPASARTDVSKPPMGGSEVFVRIIDESNGTKRVLAQDIRKADGVRKSWSVHVTSLKDADVVTLAWSKLGNNGKSVRWSVLDKTTGLRTIVADKSQIQFVGGSAGSTRLFEFTAEPISSTGPLAVSSVQTIPNRSSGGVTVRLRTTQEAAVTAVVTTVAGRQISGLLQSSRSAGSGDVTVRWDGKNADGSSVPAGPYRLEIRVLGSDNEQVVVHRIVSVVR